MRRITTMDHNDDIREQIESALRRETPEGRRLTSRIINACWPGGSGDRTEPAARRWLQQWRPSRAGAGSTLPVCSCSSGHCAVCN
jgi:hypothetical protein